MKKSSEEKGEAEGAKMKKENSVFVAGHRGLVGSAILRSLKVKVFRD